MNVLFTVVGRKVSNNYLGDIWPGPSDSTNSNVFQNAKGQSVTSNSNR
jgi:hypothetical protein